MKANQLAVAARGVERARQFLINARSTLALARKNGDIPLALEVRDRAEALRKYVRLRSASLEALNDAAEAKLEAERTVGEMLVPMPKRHGARGVGKKVESHDATPLSELGLTKTDSSRWQKVARFAADDEPAFEAHKREQRAAAQEITLAGVLRLIKARERAADIAAIRAEPAPPPEGPFRVIAADPPWAYESRALDPTHRAANPYPDMAVEDIAALGVGSLAHDDCVLWLWTTNAFMRDSYAVLDAWGFEPKTILTWVKDRMGTGDWLRGRTEHCHLAVKGRPPVELTNQTTALEAPLRQHSRKPDEFYALVEALCPAPEDGRLEMFQREPRQGWVGHGNQIGHF